MEACKLLTRTYGLQVNRSMGLHVQYVLYLSYPIFEARLISILILVSEILMKGLISRLSPIWSLFCGLLSPS